MQLRSSFQEAAVPRTRAELRALEAQRDELREQLNVLTERRGRLVSERHNAEVNNNPAIVRELDGRIAEMGTRSREIERVLTTIDDAIAKGIVTVASEGRAQSGGGAAMAPIPPIPPIPPISVSPQVIEIPSFARNRGDMVDRDVLIASLLGEALLFVLFGAVMMRRAFRRGQREALAQGAARDPQLQQSIDAIALEVERISENQRFVTKLLNENAGTKVG